MKINILIVIKGWQDSYRHEHNFNGLSEVSVWFQFDALKSFIFSHTHWTHTWQCYQTNFSLYAGCIFDYHNKNYFLPRNSFLYHFDIHSRSLGSDNSNNVINIKKGPHKNRNFEYHAEHSHVRFCWGHISQQILCKKGFFSLAEDKYW